jgi:hypothetical protein
MKKKQVKKVAKTKNNYFKYAAMMLLVVFAAVGVSKILGLEINKTTRICEDKKGNLFVPRDKDGTLDECKKHAEAVTFNFDGGSGKQIGVNGIAFVDSFYGQEGYQMFILKEDNTIWKMNPMSPLYELTWSEDTERKLPPEIKASDLLDWKANMLVTKTGEIWTFGITVNNPALGWIKLPNAQ